MRSRSRKLLNLLSNLLRLTPYAQTQSHMYTDQMTNVMKFSKPGEDVNGKISSPVVNNSRKARKLLPHLLYAVALPYLFGAKTQLARYREAVKINHPVTKVYTCLHEVSCLFEDLDTVARYAEECGDSNKLHYLWRDMRNHIRHDIREEMDDTSSKLKAARAQRLGINPKLQMELSFDDSFIKVGSTVIQLVEIDQYLAWAEVAIERVLTEAIEKGYVEGMTYSHKKGEKE